MPAVLVYIPRGPTVFNRRNEIIAQIANREDGARNPLVLNGGATKGACEAGDARGVMRYA